MNYYDKIAKKFTPKILGMIQEKAKLIWNTYDDEFGYATEKKERNRSVSVENPDNIWFFWGQFDMVNQTKLMLMLGTDESSEAKEAINLLVEIREHEIDSLLEQIDKQ